MARPDKVEAVEEIAERFRGASASVVTEYRGLTMSQLREAVLADKATLGRRVDDLLTKALVYREVDSFDRRVIRVFLSSRGRDVLTRLTARLTRA